MITLEVKKHKLELYTSSRETPIRRYHTLQKNLMIDSGIGSSMDDVVKHYSKIEQFISADKIPEAKVELSNLRMNLFAILQGYDTTAMSFACLIHSIDGQPCEDLSDEGLLKTIETLKDIGVTYAEIEKQLNDTKKKSKQN